MGSLKTRKSLPRLVTMKALLGHKAEQQRAAYVLNFMQTGSQAEACKASGLSRLAHQRIIKLLSETGGLGDSPRSGRPPSYTEEKMAGAYQQLVTSPQKLNGKQLLSKCKKRGIIHQGANHGPFMKRLKTHCKSIGPPLVTNSRKTQPFNTKGDIEERKVWSKDLLERMEQCKIRDMDIIASDETEWAEYPHPKSECGRERKMQQGQHTHTQ
jgi:hypothetical protein